MKVILDECIPKKLKSSFVGHQCSTTPEEGFAGRKNGELLSLVEQAGFQVFVTLDKGIQYQQNLTGREIAVLVIRARSNRLIDLLPHAEACLSALGRTRPGEVVVVGAT